ncbi:hypothetical protein C0J52_08669 [Blattella germanica]|nr:hypothetical protein C0J52_08669 [Blattella germanica]
MVSRVQPVLQHSSATPLLTRSLFGVVLTPDDGESVKNISARHWLLARCNLPCGMNMHWDFFTVADHA